MSSTNYACYIFINKRLSMGKGKCCSQTAHGMRYLCEHLSSQSKYVQETWDKWENNGGRTIVLYANNEAEIEELHSSYPSVKVHDAGCTQVASGSLTVLALYPKIHNRDEFKNKLVN